MFDYFELQGRINEVLGKKIFFIVGTMKSGTTWLQLILDNHPDISCKGEGHFTDILADKLARALEEYNARIGKVYNNNIFREIPDYPTLQKDHYLFVLKSSICLLLHDQTNGIDVSAIGEKTPNHIRSMPLLSRLFPAAHFIHIIRDGRDTAVSAWFHYQRVNQGAISGSFSEFIEKFAHKWILDIKEARNYGRKYPAKYQECSYEDLHDDGIAVIRQLLKFLELDSTDDIISRCLDSAAFEKLARGRKQGDEKQDSHFRKGVTGDWRNYFKAGDIDRFNKIAGATLEQMGYKP